MTSAMQAIPTRPDARVRRRGIAVALVLAGLGVLMIKPIEDPDLWWLLRAGQHMVETRTLLRTDPFSYTAAGAHWLNHAWGFELSLYAVYAVAGTTGLILAQAIFTVGVCGVLYRTLRREGTPTWSALGLLVIAVIATHGFWRARPQLVTYLGLAVFWSVLRDFREGRVGRRSLRWLPILTIAWVNLHGGFLIGLVLVGLALAGEVVDAAFAGGESRPGASARMRALGLTLVLSTLAAFLNPFHYETIVFPWQVISERLSQDFITEWASLPFQDPQVALLEGLVALFVVLCLVTPQPVRLSELGVVILFVHLGLNAGRNAPLLVIVLLPVLGRALAEWLATGPRERASRVGGRGSVLIAAGLLLAAVLAVWRGGLPVAIAERLRPGLGVGTNFPAGAVAYLKAHRLRPRLLNEYIWGGYLIWHLYPDYRVSIDGRAAIYGPGRLGEHITVVDLHPNWPRVLEHLAPDVALVRSGSPLVAVLRASGSWQTRYEDAVATLLERRASAP